MNESLVAFFNTVYFNNSVNAYLISIFVFIVSFVIFRLFKTFFLYKLEKIAKKTQTKWDDFLVDFLKEVRFFFFFLVSIYIASLSLTISPLIEKILLFVLFINIGYYIAKGVSAGIDHLVESKIEEKKSKKSSGSESLIRVFGILGKVIVWVIIFLMILSNMGIEITPLIAGLGIGGIAIALALQSILGDLFGAFAIYFDKPFQEGDFIIVGNDMGVVKNIGIKSTRIQALQGQELVMSNSELVNSRINNYKQMAKRRVAFQFGVRYDTGKKKLERIKSIVATTFKSVKGADLDRVHFMKFGSFSLEYEVVYYVLTSDYNKYMDIQEKVNLKLYSEFEKEGISFAFPTNTIEIEKTKNI
jgi:small-conductance mechanosensitive channel